MTPERPATSRIPWTLLLTVVVLGTLVSLLSDILTPFVIGVLLAYVGHPLVNRLTRTGLPSVVAALLVLLAMIGAALLVVLLVVPMLSREILLVVGRLPTTLQDWQATVIPLLPSHLGIDWNASLQDWHGLLQRNLGNTEEAFQKVLHSAGRGGAWLFHLVLTALLIPVVTFYLLKDGPRVLDLILRGLPPRWQPPVQSLGQEIDGVLGQFLRGQLLVMVTLAAYYGLALQISGLDSGLAIGLTTGLLVFIPYVGVFTGFVLAVFAALVQGPGASLLWPVVGIYTVGHLIEGTFITPRLVGERIGLHPLVVILALLSFGQLLGFFGVVIALPASAVARVVLSRLHRRWLARETETP